MAALTEVRSPSEDKAAFLSSSSEDDKTRFSVDPPLSERAMIDEKVAVAARRVLEASMQAAQERLAMEQLTQAFSGPAGGAALQPTATPGGNALVPLLQSLNTPIGARLP